MPLRPVLVALLALALPLAGCIGGDDVTPEATDPAAPADALDATTPANATTAPTLATVPFSWEGATGTWACVPAGPGSCRGPPVPLGSDGSGWHEPDLGGAPQSLTVTLAWAAATPATEEMVLYVLATSPCGDGCVSGEVLERAAGKSPLSITLPALSFTDEQTIAFGASVPCRTAGPVFGCLSLEQKYAIEGSAVVAKA